eukprot:15491648-Heterocapsa_arctica.AAC.1
MALMAGGFRSFGLYFSHTRQEHLPILCNPVCAAGEADFKYFAHSMTWDLGPTDFTNSFKFKALEAVATPSPAQAAAPPLAAPVS